MKVFIIASIVLLVLTLFGMFKSQDIADDRALKVHDEEFNSKESGEGE